MIAWIKRHVTLTIFVTIAIPFWLLISGTWLIATPWLWVDGSAGPHDLIVQGLITEQWNGGCNGPWGYGFQTCYNYNVTIGKAVVSGAGGSWKPSNETVAEKWVEVTAKCGRWGPLVMITVKDGHLQHFNGQAVEAYDPPQFMNTNYQVVGCP